MMDGWADGISQKVKWHASSSQPYLLMEYCTYSFGSPLHIYLPSLAHTYVTRQVIEILHVFSPGISLLHPLACLLLVCFLVRSRLEQVIFLSLYSAHKRRHASQPASRSHLLNQEVMCNS